ncbi:MAG: glycoside hydrolase family 16 [Myxococcales bacterium]|nr:glycoside hydrolase family 16 [Myxococcales bacterium]
MNRIHSLILISSLALTGCAAATLDEGQSLEVESSLAGATVRPLTLQTAVRGKYLTAENNGGGPVNADRDVASGWETFQLYDLNGGGLASGDLVYLAAGNGQFLCAENGGGSTLVANRARPLDWEIFRVVRVGGDGAVRDGDQIGLQTRVRGLFVSAVDGGGGGLTVDRTSISGWESFVVGGGSAPAPTPPPAWRLTFSDEFDGAAGAIDRGKWTFDVGGGGWGNNELEYYTDRTDNVALDGAGHLQIVARAEAYGGRGYTSGRINSAGHFAQAYGRFEARIRMPSGRGIWPAFWTLGENIGAAGWPRCGELDIMEAVGDFAVNHGSAHGPGYSGGNPLTGTYRLPVGSLANDFHVFAIEWDPGEVRWYVDNVMYERRTSADLPGGTTWVYDHAFFAILNVAVGGNWPGSPDGSTSFPQTMTVDYVRIYARN